MGSHESGVEGQNHLPQPAGHTSFYAAQDTVGFLGCKHTFPAHVQFFIHQYPQVLLCRTILNPFTPQPVLILGIAPNHVQALALGLVELHEVHMGLLLKPVKVPLDGILLSSVSTAPFSLVLSADLLRVHSVPLSMSLMKILNSIGPRDRTFSLSLLFFFNIPVEALLIILLIPCHIQLQLCLSFPDPISTHPGSVPIFFPGYTSLVPLPVHFLLTLYFEQEVLTEPCWSPAFLA
ncbi:hypothetical protein QYF61_004498 [Mycteria americana]|uniref:Uncharacterized protein n=1 Tax=Mycteria americana TaxID=33587 RepID=A0AAN7N897_MYCAM|nr:hypothetical protein QYF61_004498 [Mycteria americana]